MKETVVSARALMEAGQYNEAGAPQMEATHYSVQTSILDLKEQINQVENSLALLLAETPRHYERGNIVCTAFYARPFEVFPCRCLPIVPMSVRQNVHWKQLFTEQIRHVLRFILPLC